MVDQREIEDRFASVDFDEVAFEFHDDFLRMKHALVSRRKESGLTQEQVSRFLGTTKARINAFEQYYYDPKASEIRAYALAVMMRLHTDCQVFVPESAQWAFYMDDPDTTVASQASVGKSMAEDYTMSVTVHD